MAWAARRSPLGAVAWGLEGGNCPPGERGAVRGPKPTRPGREPMTRSPTLRPHKQSVREQIERPHHTAVSCRDWDKMRAFFVDLLGFKVVGEMDKRDEPELGKVTGLPGATCRWAMLALGGYHIELFKWLTPEGRPVPIRQCDHGLTPI